MWLYYSFKSWWKWIFFHFSVEPFYVFVVRIKWFLPISPRNLTFCQCGCLMTQFKSFHSVHFWFGLAMTKLKKIYGFYKNMSPAETWQYWNPLIFGGCFPSESLLWVVYPKNDFLSKPYLNKALDNNMAYFSKKHNRVHSEVHDILLEHPLQCTRVGSLFESLSTQRGIFLH